MPRITALLIVGVVAPVLLLAVYWLLATAITGAPR